MRNTTVMARTTTVRALRAAMRELRYHPDARPVSIDDAIRALLIVWAGAPEAQRRQALTEASLGRLIADRLDKQREALQPRGAPVEELINENQ